MTSSAPSRRWFEIAEALLVPGDILLFTERARVAT